MSATAFSGDEGVAALLDAALTYAEAGIPVFRCAFSSGMTIGHPGCCCYRGNRCDAPGKHPLERGGFHNATTDAATIERWWAHGPWNIGIRTGAVSGLVVLDVDPRHGGDETLAELESRYGKLRLT
jgi:hypothetical protein